MKLQGKGRVTETRQGTRTAAPGKGGDHRRIVGRSEANVAVETPPRRGATKEANGGRTPDAGQLPRPESQVAGASKRICSTAASRRFVSCLEIKEATGANHGNAGERFRRVIPFALGRIDSVTAIAPTVQIAPLAILGVDVSLVESQGRPRFRGGEVPAYERRVRMTVRAALHKSFRVGTHVLIAQRPR